MNDDLGPEQFWMDLLSEEPRLVLAAWRKLAAEEQAVVRAHLIRMSTEEGWAAAQRRAALAALRSIEKDED